MKQASTLKRSTPISKGHLIVVAVIFAAIGGYVLYRSFAAGTPTATVEAEQLLLPAGGSVITDTNASGGKAVDLSSNGAATGSVNFATSVNSVTVVARGGSCQGYPQMVVSLDGNSLLNTTVGSSAWTSYTANANYGAGTHSLSVAFTNDYSKTKGKRACSRDLYLDVANFYGNVTPPPPSPTVSLSASPSTLSAGQSSTLTWNSTNATSCTASGAWSGSQQVSGSASTGALNQSSTYILTCSNATGSGSATATVTVGQPQKPPAPTIYLNPPSQGYTVGSTFTIDLREDSGTSPVNAVQANLSYNASLLTVTSVDTSTSDFGTTVAHNGANGSIGVIVGVTAPTDGTPTVPLSGDHLVAKLTFKVAAAGTANLNFTTGTALISSTNNQNIIGSLSADGVGVYTLQ